MSNINTENAEAHPVTIPSPQQIEKVVSSAFPFYDSNLDGYLTCEELKRLTIDELTRYGFPPHQRETRSIIEKSDAGGNQEFSKEDAVMEIKRILSSKASQKFVQQPK